MNLFVTIPVSDVAAARAFYLALGWTLNEAMSDEDNVACIQIDTDKYLMVGSRAFYERVGGTEELVGGSGTPSPITVSFDLDSREAVDSLLAKAEAAGGRIGDTDDYDFMSQRQFDDLDGYHYSPFWMKPDVASGE